MSDSINIIGAGGVGSYLIPCLAKTQKDITIWDGDEFEEKNLERQLFDKADVGKNKADVLASYFGLKSKPKYFKLTSGLEADIIFCCVDNDATRMDVLEYADANAICVIIGANETYSSEAYFYSPSWKGSKRDPRIIYPEMTERKGRDPRKPPCNGVEAIEENPQLPTANMAAAVLMLKLYDYYSNVYYELDDEDQVYAPHTLHLTQAKAWSISIGDRDNEQI